jgi:hypothetical protein
MDMVVILKFHYCNIWLINVCPPMNVHKPLGQNLHQKMLMPILNFEILKRKTTKSIWIIPQVKFSKNMVLGGNFEKKLIKFNSYWLMKIWSNSNHSKVWNYDVAKVNRERALNMNLSFHITTHTKLLTRI